MIFKHRDDRPNKTKEPFHVEFDILSMYPMGLEAAWSFSLGTGEIDYQFLFRGSAIIRRSH